MGACTVTVVENTVQGNKRVIFGKIVGSASYAAGGESFTAAQMGLSVIDKMSATPSALVSAAAFTPAVIPTGGSWPASGGKLALLGLTVGAGGIAEAGTVDVSGFPCEFRAEGV